jgi:hypothetical protein
VVSDRVDTQVVIDNGIDNAVTKALDSQCSVCDAFPTADYRPDFRVREDAADSVGDRSLEAHCTFMILGGVVLDRFYEFDSS